MPSLAAYTIYAFGITAFLAGVTHLLSPSTAIASLALSESCIPAVNAIAMGIYYTLAAYQEKRTFFYLTVPMRLLTSTVFWGQGGTWKVAGMWEGGGALATAVALLWD